MMNVLTFLFPYFLTHFGQQNALQMPRGPQLIKVQAYIQSKQTVYCFAF